MQGGSDDRAVAVQVGAIILFAFVVIAIAGYQASVVPNQNNEIEFNHNQRVQGQIEDVEATIGSMPAVADRRTTTVDLSTSYPARTLFVNPPTPTGRLRTSSGRSRTRTGRPCRRTVGRARRRGSCPGSRGDTT